MSLQKFIDDTKEQLLILVGFNSLKLASFPLDRYPVSLLRGSSLIYLLFLCSIQLQASCQQSGPVHEFIERKTAFGLFTDKMLRDNRIIKSLEIINKVVDESQEDIAWTLQHFKYNRFEQAVKYDNLTTNLERTIVEVLKLEPQFYCQAEIARQQILDCIDQCSLCCTYSHDARYRLAKNKFERKLLFSQQLIENLKAKKSLID
jgi:hypothetical protein